MRTHEAKTLTQRARTVQRMKDCAARNYERGGDVLVECWATQDYERMIDDCGTYPTAWACLRAVMSVYREQRANTRNSF